MSFHDSMRVLVFHTVAKHLSFTRAAEELELTQPAVTFQIRQLEEHFNTRLFERQHNRISMTDAGRLFYLHASRILDLYQETEKRLNEVTGLSRGMIRLGATTTPGGYLLPGILCGYRDAYPGVKVRLSLHNTRTVVQKVRDTTVDIGMIEGPVSMPDLEVLPCVEDELVVILPLGHPLVDEESIPLERLLAYPFVSREEGSGTRAVIMAFLEQAGLQLGQLQTVLEVDTAEAAKSAVEHGIGFSLISRLAVRKEDRLGALTIRPIREGALTRTINLLLDAKRIRSKVTDELVQHIQTACHMMLQAPDSEIHAPIPPG
ncbi:MAG: LysR family transcriptional regulator [Magnetococcales bacterium]|nr:LysR family transcriptional regulator [Magnetococcales bacterium]